MTLRLPPLRVVFPPNAIFRQYPLPPDLLETWQILRGLAWVNKYAFTPPASIDDLLQFHHNLRRRALIYRLDRLEKTGWLTVRRISGKANVYETTVPEDKPIDYSVQAAVPSGEPTSLRGDCPEDSARRAAGSEVESGTAISHKTGAMSCTSSLSTVVVENRDQTPNRQQQQSTTTTGATHCTGDDSNSVPSEAANHGRTLDEADKQAATLEDSAQAEILELLDRIVIAEPKRSAVAVLPHMAYDYLLPWVHYAEDNPKLGGGYFVTMFEQVRHAPAGYVKHAARRELEREADARRRAEQRAADETEVLDETSVTAAPAPNPYADQLPDILPAGELWHAALGELQREMTRETFDTLLRPSHALGFDGDQLVVRIHSPYAREWLVTEKFQTKIERAVARVAGRVLAVRYEVNGHGSHVAE
jgi:hypothetical protein